MSLRPWVVAHLCDYLQIDLLMERLKRVQNLVLGSAEVSKCGRVNDVNHKLQFSCVVVYSRNPMCSVLFSRWVGEPSLLQLCFLSLAAQWNATGGMLTSQNTSGKWFLICSKRSCKIDSKIGNMGSHMVANCCCLLVWCERNYRTKCQQQLSKEFFLNQCLRMVETAHRPSQFKSSIGLWQR